MCNFFIDIFVYIFKKELLMYVDEEGCLLFGKIKIKCKRGWWLERVYVMVKMEIIGIEVKVIFMMYIGE